MRVEASSLGHTVVTGAAGFIGSTLVDELLARGHRVVGIDAFTDFYGRALKEANARRALEHPAFSLVESDLLELLPASSELRGALRSASCVYHLAAQAGVRNSWGGSFRRYTDDNVLATQAVLEACVAEGVPTLVYASSSSVYGDSPIMPLREDARCCPVSPYGVTKLAGEHLCGLYAKAQGIHTVALRFFTVFGPRQRPDMAFHRFMRALLDDAVIRMYGDGRQTRDFTFVDDIVTALLAAPEAPAGSVINVGGGHRVSLAHAIETLADVTGVRPRIETHPSQVGDARDTWADLSRARALLAYAPSVGLEEGLAAEWSWLRRL
jgi:nucleoside-diphosphate-sugar epimerase